MATPPPNSPDRNTPVKFIFPFWFKVSSVTIVVLLAGILMILLSGFLGGVSKERKKQDEEDAIKARTTISIAQNNISLFEAPLELYKLDCGSYPTTKQGLSALRNRPADLSNPEKWNGPYLAKDVELDHWNHPYKYTSPGKHNPDSYDIWSLGPDGIDGTDDDIGNWK
jgi:type II secretion system protein G